MSGGMDNVVGVVQLRVADLENRLRFQSRALILALALLFMTGTGWWLTSNDHTATNRKRQHQRHNTFHFSPPVKRIRRDCPVFSPQHQNNFSRACPYAHS